MEFSFKIEITCFRVIDIVATTRVITSSSFHRPLDLSNLVHRALRTTLLAASA